MRASALRVFCDFDGTITTHDSIQVLLTELADPAWKEIEAQWEAGRIGSRECLARQIPLIRGGWPAIERVLQTVTLDPTFAPFAGWCKSRTIPLVIVSDGLDRVIKWLLARDRISVDAIWANQLIEKEPGAVSIAFPHPPLDGSCRAGLCKCRVLEQAAASRVVIGDGLSDLCWARRAEHCFGKGKLLSECRSQGIKCLAFKDFTTIQTTLNTLA